MDLDDRFRAFIFYLFSWPILLFDKIVIRRNNRKKHQQMIKNYYVKRMYFESCKKHFSEKK